jgi:pimeloyl-ACP methyl ester carboxylesterase
MFEDGYAEVNGVRLHYVTAGDGRLVLFLHGFPEFWYAWREQMRALAPEYQAVAVDMRGYNLSDKPEGEDAYRMEHLVADIRALVGALGHERCALVGHDWGGVVAWSVAMACPDVIERLVIVNAPGDLRARASGEPGAATGKRVYASLPRLGCGTGDAGERLPVARGRGIAAEGRLHG